jgi:hypothetical protein
MQLRTKPYTAIQLSSKLQLQNEEWEHILSASGGKLELPKCLAYIVVYDWDKGKPKLCTKSEILTQLQVCSTGTQQQTSISIRDPAESLKTIGTFQNPTGNLDQQAKALQQNENKIIVFFCHSQLLTYKVNLAYHSMYTKSPQLLVGVTMMSYDTSNNISKQTTCVVIGALHVNRSLPRSLAFTGTKLLGLGL